MNIEKLKSIKNDIEKCNGDCKHCNKLYIETASDSSAIYYAFGCHKTYEIFGALSETREDLKPILLEALEFEIEYPYFPKGITI